MKRIFQVIALVFILGIVSAFQAEVHAESTIKMMQSQSVVAPDKEWTIHFSTSMSKATANSSTIYVKDENGNRLSTTVSLSKDQTDVIVHAPVGGYELGNYTLYVTGELASKLSNIKLKQPVQFNFSVSKTIPYSNTNESGDTIQNKPTSGETSNFPETNLEQVVNQSINSVVIVYAYDEAGEYYSQGSGFVVGNGLILTNYHVVAGMTNYEIDTESGDTYEVEGVVAYDEVKDLALLKVSEALNLAPLPIGTIDNVQRGQQVIAIGSPEGLINTASDGIVSGLRTYVYDEEDYVDVIQTSAPITHGSSGGPLLNLEGKVIGITSFGYETGNLNFAIAIDYAKGWIAKYSQMNLSEIPVQTLPTIEVEPVETLPGSQEPVTGTPSDSVVEPVEASFYLNEKITNPIVRDDEPIMYAIGQSNNLLEINLETHTKRSLTFTDIPEQIDFANGEIYVTLLKGQHSSYWWDEDQKGAFAVVDPVAFKVKDIVNIDMDPYDIVADENAVYISSGSGQWTYIKSYARNDFYKELDSRGIRQASYLTKDPTNSQIYAVDTDTSPRDIETFQMDDQGKFTASYDSPYHGDYSLTPDVSISTDGLFLFNQSGNVFYSSGNRQSDMQYATEIEPYQAIAFDLNNNRFFIASNYQIFEYDYSTFAITKRYQLNAKAEYLFYTSDGLYAITFEKSANSNLPHYVVKKIKL